MSYGVSGRPNRRLRLPARERQPVTGESGRERIAGEAAEARQSLEANAWQLADEIAGAVLAGQAR